jgi:DNA polymerase III alpha subunit
MGALYRPGPYAVDNRFYLGESTAGETEYLHPLMKPALESTFGVLVYQEQVYADFS